MHDQFLVALFIENDNDYSNILRKFNDLKKCGEEWKESNLLLIVSPEFSGAVKNSLFKISDGNINAIFLETYIESGKAFKITFTYAVEKKFEFVTFFRGRELDIFLGNVDRFSALETKVGADCLIACHSKGFAGNFVNWLQRISGLEKAEDISPVFAVFRVKLLESIPFLRNSDSMSFITECIIQLTFIDTKFLRIKPETSKHYSFREYTRTIFLLIKLFLHRSGIFYQRKFDLFDDNRHYSMKYGFLSTHSLTLKRIPASSRVLDIGAGPFGITPELRRKSCHVVTLDKFDIDARYKGNEHIIMDLNNEDSINLENFDYILLLDIIEHLSHPETFLEKLSRQYGYHPRILIFTTGNVTFFPLRIMFLLGFFNYGKSGILDKTHTRLYTFSSFIKLLGDNNLKVEKVKGLPAPFPKALGRNLVSILLVRINTFLIKMSRNLFSYQIYVETVTLPSPEWIVMDHMSKDSVPVHHGQS